MAGRSERAGSGNIDALANPLVSTMIPATPAITRAPRLAIACAVAGAERVRASKAAAVTWWSLVSGRGGRTRCRRRRRSSCGGSGSGPSS